MEPQYFAQLRDIVRRWTGPSEQRNPGFQEFLRFLLGVETEHLMSEDRLVRHAAERGKIPLSGFNENVRALHVAHRESVLPAEPAQGHG